MSTKPITFANQRGTWNVSTATTMDVLVGEQIAFKLKAFHKGGKYGYVLYGPQDRAWQRPILWEEESGKAVSFDDVRRELVDGGEIRLWAEAYEF